MPWDDRQSKKEELARKLAEIDKRLGIETPNKPARKPLHERSNKFFVGIMAAVIIGISVIAGVGNQVAIAIKEASRETTSTPSSSATQTTASINRYFGPGYVPFYVGGSLESAMILTKEKFDENFWRIRNLDTKSDITTSYREGRPIEKAEGLFVCSQTLAPGADVPEFAIGQITIEVSRNCSASKVPFLMGPAAEQAGYFVPTPLGDDCYRADRCEAPVLEGVFVEFLDEEYKGYKTALIETGVGKMEVDLAWIDIVAEEWCDIDDQNNDDLLAGAIEARDNLFMAGALVRLVKGDGWDDSAFFHRLNPDGTYLDGDIPENSVNELLVRSGYWMPTLSEHPWGGRLYSYNEELSNPVWAYSRPDWELSELLEAYRSRLNDAANNSHADPNPVLGYCLEQKSDQVAILLAEKQDEERKDGDDRNSWAQDVEAVWRSVFCPTRSDQFPERCASYDPAKDDLVGTSGGSSSGGSSSGSSGGSNWSGGGGTNCTWVNSYTRKDGTRVSGYYRCG